MYLDRTLIKHLMFYFSHFKIYFKTILYLFNKIYFNVNLANIPNCVTLSIITCQYFESPQAAYLVMSLFVRNLNLLRHVRLTVGLIFLKFNIQNNVRYSSGGGNFFQNFMKKLKEESERDKEMKVIWQHFAYQYIGKRQKISRGDRKAGEV